MFIHLAVVYSECGQIIETGLQSLACFPVTLAPASLGVLPKDPHSPQLMTLEGGGI